MYTCFQSEFSERWAPLDDVVMGGLSASQIVMTPEGNAKMQGVSVCMCGVWICACVCVCVCACVASEYVRVFVCVCVCGSKRGTDSKKQRKKVKEQACLADFVRFSMCVKGLDVQQSLQKDPRMGSIVCFCVSTCMCTCRGTIKCITLEESSHKPIRTYIHACIHTYIHTCMHSYTHAHTHTGYFCRK